MDDINNLLKNIKEAIGGDLVFTCKICGEDLKDIEQKTMIDHLINKHEWKNKPTFKELISNFTSGFKAKEDK